MVTAQARGLIDYTQVNINHSDRLMALEYGAFSHIENEASAKQISLIAELKMTDMLHAVLKDESERFSAASTRLSSLLNAHGKAVMPWLDIWDSEANQGTMEGYEAIGADMLTQWESIFGAVDSDDIQAKINALDLPSEPIGGRRLI